MKSETPTETQGEIDDSSLYFAGAERIITTKDHLWSVISDPERLVEFVPGAAEVERVSERKYTGEIERGVSHITLLLTGEVELVEINEPDWIIAEGNVYDSKTHSSFDIFAAMELTEVEAGAVKLSYSIDIPFTGGVKSLSRPIIRHLISSDIEDYFDNIRDGIENGGHA